MEWPGYEEGAPIPAPIIINQRRPRPNRGRPDYGYHRPPPVVYAIQDGQLLVPAGGYHHSGHYRSSSVSGSRPAQVIINNDNMNMDGRPQSVHYDIHDYDPRRHERSRSRRRSRSRHGYASRTPSPYYEDPETKGKLNRLQELERKQEEAEREKRVKEKFIADKAKKDAEEAEMEKRLKEKFELERRKKEAEEAEREKEEKEMKKRAVEDYKAQVEKEKAKEKKEKEEADKEFDERMRKTLRASGYTEVQIEKIIKKERGDKVGGAGATIMALNRPTYIRVRRKHLDPETLRVYELPWEWDETDENFIIIKQWIPERDQEILFEHTRKLKENRQLTYTTTQLRKDRDQLVIVKKKGERTKSPNRKNWLLT